MIGDIELGIIKFRYNPFAKRIIIRVRRDGLLVTLPLGMSFDEGMDFIQSIRKKLIYSQGKTVDSGVILSENNPLKTLTFDILVKAVNRSNLYASLQNGTLTIEYPHNLNISATDTQRHIWGYIDCFLSQEAKRLLPAKTATLAAKYGFNYSKVKIQSSKTRWGSCSSKHSINLSYYLLLLPEHLIDYVILHELCHTREMNHGPRFWGWMDRVTDGRSKLLRQELRTYSIPS